jgi:hypothetical protein
MKLIGSQFLSVGMLFSLVISLATIATAQTAAPVISLLFSFPCNSSSVCPDGFFPTSLIESADGNFYGIAASGGTGLNAQGTIFKIAPAGQAESANGSLPNGASPTKLGEAVDGFLYGTALVAGANGQGTVFKLSKSGTILGSARFLQYSDQYRWRKPCPADAGSRRQLLRRYRTKRSSNQRTFSHQPQAAHSTCFTPSIRHREMARESFG